jgi:SAM-dependent methyltransferase
LAPALELAKADSIRIDYQPDPAERLALLCDRQGSDKGSRDPSVRPYSWPPHSYTDFYAMLFEHCRSHVRAVFECGLGTNNTSFTSNMGLKGRPGASLRVWRDYFPNATVVGADIDRGVLFEEERIRTHWVDQTNPAAIAAMWAAEPIDAFDLMVDDGLHEFAAGACLFEHSWRRLAPGGIYVIEDVGEKDLERYRGFFATGPWLVAFVRLERRGLALGDNSLVVVRRSGA